MAHHSSHYGFVSSSGFHCADSHNNFIKGRCELHNGKKSRTRTRTGTGTRAEQQSPRRNMTTMNDVDKRERLGRETKGTTIISWNVNSLRALLRKDSRALEKLVTEYEPDILCLQETKLQGVHEKLYEDLLEEYGLKYCVFNSSTSRLGYSGTVTYMRSIPRFVQTEIRDEIGNTEGRFIAAFYEHITVVNVYTMNSGANFKRLKNRYSWDCAFRQFIRQLQIEDNAGAGSTDGIAADRKPVLIVGDLNVAHKPLDVFDFEKCKGVPGCHELEITSFNDLLETCDLVDVFRYKFGDVEDQFSYWDYRTYARRDNRGMRIDYALASRDMANGIRDMKILNDIEGSDHCPILVSLHGGFIDYSENSV